MYRNSILQRQPGLQRVQEQLSDLCQGYVQDLQRDGEIAPALVETFSGYSGKLCVTCGGMCSATRV